MSEFKDHFSGHAAHYAAARPRYPEALFDWLLSITDPLQLAWDVGCGNGQAATALAERLVAVQATDASAEQIAAARAHPGVRYRVEPAECSSLPDNSVDLITIAQALHWFDHPCFFAEARRVLRPGGVIAAWCYGLCRVSARVDAVFVHLYDEVLGPYWPPERHLVENGYRELDFPFDDVRPPALEMRCDWTLSQYLAYLGSWSASQRHLQATGADAVAQAAERFAEVWGDPIRTRPVRWPLEMRIGRTAW